MSISSHVDLVTIWDFSQQVPGTTCPDQAVSASMGSDPGGRNQRSPSWDSRRVACLNEVRPRGPESDARKPGARRGAPGPQWGPAPGTGIR